MAFNFSRDMDRLRRRVFHWSKLLFREEQEVVAEIISVVTGYLRAQALSSLLVGIMLTVGLLFLGWIWQF